MKLLRSFNSVIIFSVVLFSFSCTTSPKRKNTNQETPNQTTSIKYSKGFLIHKFDDYTEVIVNNPWEKEAVYAKYYLVNDKNSHTPKDGIKIQIPLKSIASGSVTHYEFLNLLGVLNTVTGVCQGSVAYNQTIRKGLEDGKITDLGDPFNINLEKVLQLSPSCLMMSGYNQSDLNAQRILQAGIPVIYNNEWMETSLLGRAEWMKFVAVFYSKEKLADSIFNIIENRYNRIKAKASSVKNKPTIMAGSNFRGTWYMPAGHSFMGQLFADGGTNYFYSNNTAKGSLPLNVEVVLKNFSGSEFWLNCNYATLAELLKADPKHALFNPVKKKQVYNFNKRMLPSGANDFWESAIARPDLLLSDVIAILHPEILPDYQLFYAEKLK